MRVKVVICGHCDVAEGLRSAAKMICGTKDIEALPFREGDNLYEYSEQIRQTVAKLEAEGNEVVVLADLLGGTPYNAAVLALAGSDLKAQLLTGANLAMVLELVTISERDSVDAEEIVGISREAICAADLSGYLK